MLHPDPPSAGRESPSSDLRRAKAAVTAKVARHHANKQGNRSEVVGRTAASAASERLWTRRNTFCVCWWKGRLGGVAFRVPRVGWVPSGSFDGQSERVPDSQSLSGLAGGESQR